MLTPKTLSKISILIPAFNEAQSIQKCTNEIVEILDTNNYAWEIIVIDDGSRDETYDQICTMSALEPNIKGISLSRNFGKEAAMLAGLEYASGDAAIIMDADLQHPASLIPSMIDQWRMGSQIVHAVKRSRQEDSVVKRSLVYSINKMISKLGGIDVNNSSDFKLLDREIVDIIVHSLPEKMRFFRGLTSWIGFSEAYIYFDVASRQEGESKFCFLSLLELSITALTSFTNLPLRIVTFFGAVTLILGFIIAGEAIWSLIGGHAVSGYATIIITLLLIGSFIMISLGIIGEYIARIYEEVKARPHFLVKASVGVPLNKNQ